LILKLFEFIRENLYQISIWASGIAFAIGLENWVEGNTDRAIIDFVLAVLLCIFRGKHKSEKVLDYLSVEDDKEEKS